MINNRAIFKTGYQKLIDSLQRRWIEGHKTEDIGSLVTRGMGAYRFTDEISNDQRLEIEMQLKIDLSVYFEMIKAQPIKYTDSPQYLAIEGTLWSWLLAISDKSQLEWLEISEDFKHDGVYDSGEVVGLGHLACYQCQHELIISHPEMLPSCPQCGGEKFKRIQFTP